MSVPHLVVDASALVVALTAVSEPAVQLRWRLGTAVTHAPHLVDAELGSALRGLVLAGEQEPDSAELSPRDGSALVDHRYDHHYDHHGDLAAAAWELRHHVSFYDALYAALAAGLGCALVTGDRRLAAATGLPCEVDLFSPR